jgi:hypothetical protein
MHTNYREDVALISRESKKPIEENIALIAGKADKL